MRISTNSIIFYASGGHIVSVVTHSADEVTVTAKLYGEDNHASLRSLKLRLSWAGTRLERDDSDAFYYRCAGNVDSE